MIPFVKGKIWYIIVGVEKEKGEKEKKKRKKMILLILRSAWLLIGGCLHHLDLTFWCIFIHLDAHCLPFLSRKKKDCFGDKKQAAQNDICFPCPI